MGKAILIFVVSITVVGAYYARGDQSAQLDTTRQQATDEFSVLARNAALMGLDRVEQSLADDFKSYPQRTGSYDGAQYIYEANRQGKNRVIVRTKGTVQSRDGKVVAFNIRAAYERRPWSRIEDDPPLFMNYALHAGNGIHINGAVKGHAYLPPDLSSAPVNTDFHTNGILEVKGNSPDIQGFGTYGLGVLKSKAWVSKSFVPNDNPTSSETVYQVAPVALPLLEPSAMAGALVADSVTAGSVVINDTGSLPPMNGTRDDPYVWNIQGNLTLSGDIVVPGYVVFLVDNTVSFDGRITSPQTNFDGSDESTVAYYAAGLASLAGNTEVWGQIFSTSANFSGNGTVTLYGNLVTHGQVDFGGTVDFYYRRASPALTTYFQGGTNDRLVRVTYSEWTEAS